MPRKAYPKTQKKTQRHQLTKNKKTPQTTTKISLQPVHTTTYVARPFQFMRDRERVEQYHTEIVVLQNDMWRKMALLPHDAQETRRMLRNRQEAATFVSQINRMMTQNEGLALMIETASGENVGYVFITESLDPLSMERIGIIGEMYMEETWRGQGAGTFALQESEKWLSNRGTRAFQIFVTKTNVDAVQLYQKNGYAIVDYRMIKRSPITSTST
ncbi:GNAT family N-acetyltransferase [Sulfoacidibacillus ferrooxidans]|uniref:N-acetyltransferase domain-containing protein n=1 Tax=Sulfoacidibacillus ferrooxidans TaxID=2005001 RepID=A0A9X1V9L3_9BACL|nr:hypothetical protein [Sulfoacidibacillus ferrooxidans]